jgi:hypothetical protein
MYRATTDAGPLGELVGDLWLFRASSGRAIAL